MHNPFTHHIHQTHSFDGGITFELCLNAAGITIVPRSDQARQVLEQEVKRITRAVAEGAAKQELIPFRLPLSCFASLNQALDQPQAPDSPLAGLAQWVADQGKQAGAAAFSPEDLQRMGDFMTKATQTSAEVLKQVLVDALTPRQASVDQLLDDAAATLDGLDVDNPHRHSVGGQAAADAVQAWLTEARSRPLKEAQIVRLESLRSRLRCYRREVA